MTCSRKSNTSQEHDLVISRYVENGFVEGSFLLFFRLCLIVGHRLFPSSGNGLLTKAYMEMSSSGCKKEQRAIAIRYWHEAVSMMPEFECIDEDDSDPESYEPLSVCCDWLDPVPLTNLASWCKKNINCVPDVWRLDGDSVLQILEVKDSCGLTWERLTKFGLIEDLLFYCSGMHIDLIEHHTIGNMKFVHNPTYAFDVEVDASPLFDHIHDASDAEKLRHYYRQYSGFREMQGSPLPCVNTATQGVL